MGDDCGVLAAAYATELVAGDGVAGLFFQVDKELLHVLSFIYKGVKKK